jgi:hypothetical protein
MKYSNIMKNIVLLNTQKFVPFYIQLFKDIFNQSISLSPKNSENNIIDLKTSMHTLLHLKMINHTFDHSLKNLSSSSNLNSLFIEQLKSWTDLTNTQLTWFFNNSEKSNISGAFSYLLSQHQCLNTVIMKIVDYSNKDSLDVFLFEKQFSNLNSDILYDYFFYNNTFDLNRAKEGVQMLQSFFKFNSHLFSHFETQKTTAEFQELYSYIEKSLHQYSDLIADWNGSKAEILAFYEDYKNFIQKIQSTFQTFSSENISSESLQEINKNIQLQKKYSL